MNYTIRFRRRHAESGRLRAESGTSLIEILISLVILTFGLLGLAALQGRANTAELEAYQRGQALILMQDMVSRIENNVSSVASYVTGATAPVGAGLADAADCTTLGNRAATDLCEWSKTLKGSSEVVGTSNKGAMIDGRGCVETITAGREYRVSVVWQGMGKIANPTTTTCGNGSYDSSESRRAVTTIIRIPDLTAA